MRQSERRPHSWPPVYFAFIWLIYMVLPLYYVIYLPAAELTVSLVLLTILSILYVYSFMNRRYRLASVLVQIAIVAAFSFWFGKNNIYLAFYPSPLIGTMPTKRQTVIAEGALVGLLLAFGWHFKLYANHDEIVRFVPSMLIMLFLPIVTRRVKKSNELREKLSLANEEIARLSKNEERQRISRDLHDTLGHTLSLITLKSELAERLIVKNPEHAVQEVKDIQNTSRAALKQVRELVSGMHAVTVRDELVHARQLLSAANMDLEVRGGFTEGAAMPLADNILGMCLREAVTNAVKHSRGRTCIVEWVEESSCLKLVVSDDGVGFDATLSEGLSSGSGLRGMKERLKLVEGDMMFETAEDRGTTITFMVPRMAKSIEAGESNR